MQRTVSCSLNTVAAVLATVEAARRLAEFGPDHAEEVGREQFSLARILANLS